MAIVDEASKAYAAVSAQLDSWTSPRVGTMSSSNWRTYEEDAVQWMDTTLGDSASSSSPQKRPAARDDDTPETPVMSNSAKKSHRAALATTSSFDLMDIPQWTPPLNNTNSSTNSSTNNNNNNNNDEYRLYHDALLRYLQGSQRASTTNNNTNKNKDVDLGYLSTLAASSTGGDRSPLWSLLCKLRGLGMEALWMDDSEMAKRQQQIALSETLLRLSTSSSSSTTTTTTTAQQLLTNLYHNGQTTTSTTSTSTLLIQRRKALLEWMQECAAAKNQQTLKIPKPATQMWPDSYQALKHGMASSSSSRKKITSLHPDAPLLVSETNAGSQQAALFGNDSKADEELLQACLQYILAGRLDQAMDLCRQRGQPWRAAIWQGGRPLEVVSTNDNNNNNDSSVVMTVGNPARLLWKSQCRKLAANTTGAESAIYALLSNDMESALSNPTLRSWEAGLYACVSSLVGRMEDELLHRYHARLRANQIVVLPGSEYEQEEMEHLLATANAAMLNETTIFDRLAASPYQELHGNNSLQQLVAAFIKGKNAVMTTLLLRTTSMQQQESNNNSNLRSMTHLLLYLDSSFIPGLEHMKEDCIQQYLRHLAGRPDLVKFTTVYASMLPPPTMLEVLPGLLTSVQVPEERHLIWRQMKSLLEDGTDILILQRVVRLILGDETISDARKCQSIGWLCFSPDHYGEALLCANELVRQLLLPNEQAEEASQFLWDYFPTIVQQDNDNDAQDGISAKREYDALLVYLEANTAFDRWKDCMTHTQPESTASAALDMTKLDDEAKEIARLSEKRRLIEEKRELAQKVISIANAAQVKLEEVLTFDGGWLQEYEDDDEVDTPEELKRQEELEILQSHIIPKVVFFAHNVYTETATFMKTMLDDAVPIVGKDATEVLTALDATGDDSLLSPFAPLYWLHHARGLANKVASDEYSVCDAFDEEALTHFLALMEDVTIRVLAEEEAP